jgi:hypothetical protein
LHHSNATIGELEFLPDFIALEVSHLLGVVNSWGVEGLLRTKPPLPLVNRL